MFAGLTRPLRAGSVALSLCLLLAGQPALAQDRDPVTRNNNSRVTVEIGQPNVWSLAQAHYLLAVMRHTNRDLKVNVPDPTKLDPNTINGNRLELIRQMFGLEAQFNQVTGTQNRANLDRFNSDFDRRQAVRGRLDQRRDVLFTLIGDISLLNSQLAQEQAAGPFTGEAEQERQAKIRDLQNAIAGRNSQKAAVEAEIAALNAESTALNTAVGTGPTLTSPLAAATPAPLVDFSSATTALINQAVSKFQSPSLDSSIILDNHIQMQYEIIAKQLTLLRDELGPDERLIFLELPTSIYTVPTKDNDYVVQVELEVASYIAARRRAEQQQQRQQQQQQQQQQQPRGRQYGEPGFVGETINVNVTNADIREILNYITEQYGVNFVVDSSVGRVLVTANLTEVPWNNALDAILASHRLGVEVNGNILRVAPTHVLHEEKATALRLAGGRRQEGGAVQEGGAPADSGNKRPITMRDLMQLKREGKGDGAPSREANEIYTKLRGDDGGAEGQPADRDVEVEFVTVKDTPEEQFFRIIDLIPRQSDLNVNDAVGSVRNWNFAGALNFLFGFGARIGFQRQREQFEQFIQQEVFASAYGKGRSRFGWTFGPHPGTTRLNPGLRTTYAIMVVPRDALAVELNAKGKVFHRKRSPDYDKDEDNVNTFPRSGSQSFTLLVPQEATERFFVKGIDYTPAPKGGRVTALLTGEHFSPQIGVFVNGTPLTRAVSITKHESSATSGINATSGIQGEYEFLSSENIVLNFSMGDPNYTGTPLITLVTPEKTAAINFFTLDLRHAPGRRGRLIEEGERYPMFLDSFDLTRMDKPVGSHVGRFTAELHGSGFVQKAKFWINGHEIVCQGGCYGETSAGRLSLAEPTLLSSRRYRVEFPREWVEGEAESKIKMTQHSVQGIQEKIIVFNQTIPGEFEVVDVRHPSPHVRAEIDLRLKLPTGHNASSVMVEAGSALPAFVATHEGNNVYLFTFRARHDTLQLSVPTSAGGRKTLKIPLPLAPSVTRIRNPNTGHPSAPAETDGLQAVIEGRNFAHVRRVLFGTQPAEIISIDSDGRTIYVNLPKGAAGRVNVLLETDVVFKGRKVSNVADFGPLGRAHFTFIKPPERPPDL